MVSLAKLLIGPFTLRCNHTITLCSMLLFFQATVGRLDRHGDHFCFSKDFTTTEGKKIPQKIPKNVIEKHISCQTGRDVVISFVICSSLKRPCGNQRESSPIAIGSSAVSV
eukprot:TRINITY_DN7665_c1_g1_i2.p2 TRINITY_DN7665_c1_g1~~TRINITY_DN7665_c1_g1_i2.p2  ORF type:complete len:111 (-),score=8.96 TRINITY_DN7665_c1_g1_i2:148-480(-)